METLLEQQRRYHEERERLVDAMTKEMLHQKKTVSFFNKFFVKNNLISFVIFFIALTKGALVLAVTEQGSQ